MFKYIILLCINMMEDNNQVFKYICESCNFKCNYESQWNKHIITELHLTGHKKKRSDSQGPYICEKCNKKTKNMNALKQHNLNEHGTLEEREKDFKYYCKLCDFGSFSKNIYENHIISDKHKKFEERHNLKKI